MRADLSDLDRATERLCEALDRLTDAIRGRKLCVSVHDQQAFVRDQLELQRRVIVARAWSADPCGARARISPAQYAMERGL